MNAGHISSLPAAGKTSRCWHIEITTQHTSSKKPAKQCEDALPPEQGEEHQKRVGARKSAGGGLCVHAWLAMARDGFAWRGVASRGEGWLRVARGGFAWRGLFLHGLP